MPVPYARNVVTHHIREELTRTKNDMNDGFTDMSTNERLILDKLGDICLNTASITIDTSGLATDTLQTSILNRLDPSVSLSINDSVDSTINYVGNVASGGTYTSSAELSRLADVGMFAKATGAGVLKFQFSYDNSDWSTFPVNGFNMAANVPEFHTAVKLPRWFRYQFDNCAGVDVSLNAYVYYSQNFRQGNLPLNQGIGDDNDATLTRSVAVGSTVGGNYGNVGITSTKAGKQSLQVAVRDPLTAFGEMKVAQSTPEVQLSFVYGAINPLLVNTDTSGGTVSAANSLVSVASGASSGSYAALESKRYVKYRTGQGSTFRGTAIFDTAVTGNQQLIGVGTADNGYFFGYNDQSFGVLRRDNAVDTWVYQANWNQDVMDGTGDSGVTLNAQTGNVYQVSYQWLGFGAVTFAIEAPDGTIRPVHVIEYANNNTTPSVRQPALPIRVSSDNTGGAVTSVTVKSSSLAGFNEGKIGDLGTTYSSEATALTGVTTEVPVLSIKVNETVNGIEAYVPVLPQEFTAVGEGTGSNPVRFSLYVDASLGVGASFTDVDGSFSTVSVDTGATTLTGGTKIGSYVIERNNGLQINLKEKNLELDRNQILTCTAQSASSVDPDCALVWKEADSG